MEIRKFRWVKALAIFTALTVVMMYSVTNITYADGGRDGGGKGGNPTGQQGGGTGNGNGNGNGDDHSNGNGNGNGDNHSNGNGNGNGDNHSNGNNGNNNGDNNGDNNGNGNGSGNENDGDHGNGSGGGHDGDPGNGHNGGHGGDPGNGHNGGHGGDPGNGHNGGHGGDCDETEYDVGITKTAVEDYLNVGDNVQFTITVENFGTEDAENVVVKDLWPAGLSQGAVTLPEGVTVSGTNQWEIAELGSGESLELKIEGVATSVGEFTNKAEVSFASDENLENNNDDVTVIVQGEEKSDLGITKTANQTSMLIGAGVDFTVIVTNHGTKTANDITVKDLWPEGLSLSAVTADQNTTFAGTTWNIDELNSDESKVLTLSAITTATGTITNSVELYQAIWDNEEEGPTEVYVDDEANNNSDSATITVNTQTSTTTTTTTRRTSAPTVSIPVEEIPLTDLIAEDPVIQDEPTPLADIEDPNVPQTGDASNIWLLLGLMFCSGTGIVALGRRKENAGK